MAQGGKGAPAGGMKMPLRAKPDAPGFSQPRNLVLGPRSTAPARNIIARGGESNQHFNTELLIKDLR